jgi:glucose-6-phosphate dehydrogenase assembly protein OpcA
MEEAVIETVAPEKILKQLAQLWVTMGKQGSDEGGHGVLRACSMTLVVMAEETDDISQLGETLAALMPEHPARAIVIRLRGDGERGLSERVYAQCWMPFGQRRQICCEQVEIMASDAALADLPSVVLPLAVADLPVILWCRSARVLDRPEFRSLADQATRVIINSGDFADAAAAFRWLAAAVESTRRSARPLFGDLAWTQMTRWREMLAQVFENRQNLARLTGDMRIRVSDGGRATTRALYFAAWVKNALESLGATAAVTLTREPMTSLELTAGDLSVRLERQGVCLATTVDGATQCTNLTMPNDYLLLREELGIVRRDAVFERTLASAARLAYATE